MSNGNRPDFYGIITVGQQNGQFDKIGKIAAWKKVATSRNQTTTIHRQTRNRRSQIQSSLVGKLEPMNGSQPQNS